LAAGIITMTTALLEEKDHYLADFAQLEKELGDDRWTALRQAAIERFAELGFPSADNEEWRFTNVAPLTQVPFRRADAAPSRELFADAPDGVSTDASREGLIFVNGVCAVPFEGALPPGVIIQPLARAMKDHAELVAAHLGRHAKTEDQPFAALNTAFFRDGAFIYLPKNAVIGRPIHLMFAAAARGEPTVAYPRTLIIAEAGSQATIVESYLGRDGEVYCTNAVTEIVAAAGAVLDHYKIQRESEAAFHIAAMQVHQSRSSNVRSHSVALGGRLVRNDINAVLDDEGCECTLNGLTMIGGKQHVDNHTCIDHAKPHCASHELYKHVLDGQARAVFNGKIFVREDAQKTDAKQTNQTLLLSEDAVIDTKPQLEIFADDVKCTHGATVGQLDETMIFYLRSRGLGLAEARSLLTYAFANDIVSRINVKPIRAQLEELLLAAQGLPQDEEVSEES